MMVTVEYAHRQPSNRKAMASKIDQTICLANVGTVKNGTEMEALIYETSKCKEDYFKYITRLIVLIRESGNRVNGNLIDEYADVEQPYIDPLAELPGFANRGFEENVTRRLELSEELRLPEPSMRSGSMLSPGGESEQSAKYKGDYSWKTPAFRKSVILKFDQAAYLYAKPTCKNVMELEQFIFDKAKSRDEYTTYAQRVLTYIQEMDAKMQSNGKEEKPVSDISDLVPPNYAAFLNRKTGRIHLNNPFQPQIHYSHYLARMPPKRIMGGG